MCANYRPPPRERLWLYPLPEPDFGYGETYPGHVAPVLTNFARHLWLPACLGLIPSWAKDATIARHTYNARSETVAEKPSFRSTWKRRQFFIIPADAFYEPCYERGKPVCWRIEWAEGRPIGLAGIWERRLKDDGLPSWSMSMLTINAGSHPVMQRFHKPEDEKRSVVILPDDAWDDWPAATSDSAIRSFLQLAEPDFLVTAADPRRAGG